MRTLLLAAALAATAELALGSAHGETADTPDQPAASLHRLGADAAELRFAGESASRTYPVFLTAAEAAAPGHLHLAYSKAAVVMPEGSTLRIAVNGVAVGSTPIRAPEGSGPQGFDVDLPQGLVQPGFNALTLQAEQRHVVDCSMAATYELWTQIDPAATGFVFDRPAAVADLADLPGLPPGPDGATSIRLVMRDAASPGGIEQLLHAAQALAIRSHYGHPVFSVADALTGQPGLDLVVGSAEALSEAGVSGAARARAVLLPGSGPDNVVLALSGETGPEIDAAVHELLPDRGDAQPKGTDSGLRALARADGLAVEGGADVSFRTAGLPSQEFSGRLLRTAFDLRMPFDFYPADYDTLTLAVDGAYAANLDPSDQILVRVNDHDVFSLPLPDPAGAILRGRPITVPLSKLRPGLNRIGIEAMVASPADRVCDVGETLDPRRRFLLLDSSHVAVPALARIAHLPSLAALAASGFPYAGRTAPLTLYLPDPGADAVGAAATVLAQLAMAAGQPIPTRLAVSEPPREDEPALIVGALGDLPDPIVAAVGIDGAATRGAWAHAGGGAAEAATSPPAETATAVPAETPAPVEIAAPAPPDGSADNDMLLRNWSRGAKPGAEWAADLRRLARGAMGRVFGRSGIAPSLLGTGDTPYTPDAAARLVVAQHEAKPGSGATWTLVTAPSRAALDAGARELTGASRWRQLDGAIVALEGPDDPLTVQVSTTRYFVPTTPLTPGNVRLIAAGWLSDHVRVYVAVFLGACVVLGFMTAAVLARSGVRE